MRGACQRPRSKPLSVIVALAHAVGLVLGELVGLEAPLGTAWAFRLPHGGDVGEAQGLGTGCAAGFAALNEAHPADEPHFSVGLQNAHGLTRRVVSERDAPGPR